MLKKFQVFMNSRQVSSHLCEFVDLRQFGFVCCIKDRIFYNALFANPSFTDV